MTSPHLAESLRRYSAKASTGPGIGCTAKRSRYFFWNSGSLTTFCTSALTFLIGNYVTLNDAREALLQVI